MTPAWNQGEIAQRCDGDSVRVRVEAYWLSDADAREDVLPGVYKTNVAGIGIRVAASTQPSSPAIPKKTLSGRKLILARSEAFQRITISGLPLS